MGVTDKLLVDLKEIEEMVSEFDKNIDPRNLKTSTRTCQDKYTRSILGDPLYFDLLDKFDPVTGTVQPPYEVLLTYVQAHLIYRVCQRSVFIIHNNMTNKGIQNSSSDYSIAGSDTNVFRTANIYKSDAEFYEKRLWNYLKLNKDDYPLWSEKSDDIEKQEPTDDFGFMIV